MSLYNQLVEALPELENSPAFFNGEIILRNDSDGIGDYIFYWAYSEPIPNGFILGKPLA